MADTSSESICDGCSASLQGTKVSFRGGLYCEKCFRCKLRGKPVPNDGISVKASDVTLSNFEYVCTLDEIRKQGGRLKKTVRSRTIALILSRQTGNVIAMDNLCYHHGGPLDTGDIEDLGGKECIRCPWHGYQIELITGEGLFQSSGGSVKSKGKKQRIHEVKMKEGGRIYVKLNLQEPPYLPSDDYQ